MMKKGKGCAPGMMKGDKGETYVKKTGGMKGGMVGAKKGDMVGKKKKRETI